MAPKKKIKPQQPEIVPGARLTDESVSEEATQQGLICPITQGLLVEPVYLIKQGQKQKENYDAAEKGNN